MFQHNFKIETLNLAAHCCSKDKFSIQNVYIGHVDRLNLDSKEAIPISSFRIHPDFNEETLENDLCLIKLARELEYSDTVQPLCINDGEFELESGREAFIAGWGLVKEDGSASQFLKEARIPIVSDQECSGQWIENNTSKHEKYSLFGSF